MFRRVLMLVLLVGFAISEVSAAGKKGVGLADLGAADRIEALNVDWYYTWKPEPIRGAPSEKFVPMLSGVEHRLAAELKVLRERGRVPALLVINEPNQPGQALMSVAEALQMWPLLEPLADRISTPAAAGVLGPWFDSFFRKARAQGLRMDFMAVHLYGPPDPEKFLAKIDAVHERYKLPIWITEFAVADWEAKGKRAKNRYSEEQVLHFMQKVLPELEKRSFVERYAWFGAGKIVIKSQQIRPSRLFEDDGSLSALGRYYASFGARESPATSEEGAPAPAKN